MVIKEKRIMNKHSYKKSNLRNINRHGFALEHILRKEKEHVSNQLAGHDFKRIGFSGRSGIRFQCEKCHQTYSTNSGKTLRLLPCHIARNEQVK